MEKKTERLGEIRENKQGLEMMIVEYVNNKRVCVEFVETGERRWTSYSRFAKGQPMIDLRTLPSRPSADEPYDDYDIEEEETLRKLRIFGFVSVGIMAVLTILTFVLWLI